MREKTNGLHRIALLGSAMVFLIIFNATAFQAIAADTATDAEIKALKQRVLELEQQSRQNSHADRKGTAATENKASDPPPVVPGQELGGTEVTVGGQIRLDAAYNDPSGPSDYGMGTSAIPSPAAAQGQKGQFSMQARSSRFWFKSDTPIDGDHLKTLIEIDFWGSAGNERVSNSHNIRLRHAYAVYKGFTIGQTSSTFMHSGTTPDIISDGAGDVYERQPLIRYTAPFDNGDFQIALEQPDTTLTDINGNRIVPNDDRFPDLAAKLTWRPDWGQLSLSGLLRQLRIDTGAAAIGGVPAGVVDQAVGGGFFASMRARVTQSDDLCLGFAIGNALGRYVGYNSFNDAAIDGAGNIKLQREMDGFAGFRHWWNDNWHSSVAIMRSQIWNDLRILPPTAFRWVQSIHANLRWSPLLNTSAGIEYIHANSMKENGEKSTLRRVHLQWVYRF